MTPKELSGVVKSQAGTVGIVFGREGTGLTNAELDQCDATLTIPTSTAYQTLNVSHAAAIVFYELHSASAPPSTDEFSTEPVKKTILRFLSQSAALSGMEEDERRLLTRAFRNVLGRSALRHREGNLLAEVMRRISETLARVKSPQDYEMQLHVSKSDAPVAG